MEWSMDTNKRPTGISITTAALIMAVALLATSTLYFGYLAKPSTPNSNPNSALYSKAYQIPYVGNAIPPSGSNALSVGSSSTGNSITVNGAGAVSYIPNEALVSVGVITNSPTAEGATSANAATAGSVIKALNGIGISNSSIETQGYNLNANYASCYTACTPQITSFTVTNSLQVNITSATPQKLGLQVGLVIDTAVKAGANQINLSFAETTSVLAGLTNSALQQAVASASSQAHVIAASLGVSISGVVSASEGVSYTPQYYGTFSAAAAINAVQTPILPGTQSMTVTLQVVYAIS
jgi:uncharacterized protein YggE